MSRGVHKACVACGEPATDAQSNGRLISGGYSSAHDGCVYVKTIEAPLPTGDLCDPCVDGFILSHRMVHAFSLGEQHANLPVEAYREIFLIGQDQVAEKIKEMREAILTGERDESVRDFLLNAVPSRKRDPLTAGLMAGILAAFGEDVSGVAQLYGEAVFDDEDSTREFLKLLEE